MFRRVIVSSTRAAVKATRPYVQFSTTPNLPGLTPEQIQKIGDKDISLRSSHLKLENNLSEAEKDAARRKRMIYRSKQRGWLEADILLGSWAVINVPTLTADELDQYEVLLQEETIDIYNYVSGKDPLPDHLKNLSVMKNLQDYAKNSKVTDPDLYEILKRTTNLT